MINVLGVINDHRVSQRFSIFRKSGEWENGRFNQNEAEVIMQGVISVAKSKDIEMIPEGDRVGGEMAIHTIQEIFVTREEGTSDELFWNGERYKIYSVSPYKDYGYYKAIAMRKVSN